MIIKWPCMDRFHQKIILNANILSQTGAKQERLAGRYLPLISVIGLPTGFVYMYLWP